VRLRRQRVQHFLEKAIEEVAVGVASDAAEIRDRIDGICSGLRLPDQVPGLLRRLFQLSAILRGREFSKGFAGIVLTAIVGRLLDSSYTPSRNFYSANPRPLFEKGIYPILGVRHGAPMGKSDPVNVAKAADELSETWADRRRPRDAALAAVELTQYVDAAPEQALQSLLRAMVWTYLSLAKLYTAHVRMPREARDLELDFSLLSGLIREAPAGGATAQAVVGSLLRAQHELFSACGMLEGIGESVYATNTTAKKAGDFAENLGPQLHVYEVTTKPVDQQRLDESAAAVSDYCQRLSTPPVELEVTFLCDPSLFTAGGPERATSVVCGGVRFEVVDMGVWIAMMMERVGPLGRTRVVGLVRDYVAESSTQLAVKSAWARLTASASSSDQPEAS